MIRLNIASLLEERGKTRYWLSKQIGMSHQNVTKLANGATKGIRLETIEVLCQVLDCTPDDLFVMNFEQTEGPQKK